MATCCNVVTAAVVPNATVMLTDAPFLLSPPHAIVTNDAATLTNAATRVVPNDGVEPMAATSLSRAVVLDATAKLMATPSEYNGGLDSNNGTEEEDGAI